MREQSCPICKNETYQVTFGKRGKWNYRTFDRCDSCAWANDPGVSEKQVSSAIERAGLSVRDPVQSRGDDWGMGDWASARVATPKSEQAGAATPACADCKSTSGDDCQECSAIEWCDRCGDERSEGCDHHDD